MIEVGIHWPILAIALVALSGLFGLILHSRKEVANFRVHVAEQYVTKDAHQAAFDDLVRRLERIEDLLNRQFGAAPARD